VGNCGLFAAGKTTLQPPQIRQLQMQKRPGQVQIQAQQKVTGNQFFSNVPGLYILVTISSLLASTFACVSFNTLDWHSYTSRQSDIHQFSVRAGGLAGQWLWSNSPAAPQTANLLCSQFRV